MTGRPEELLAVADALRGASDRLVEHREAVGARVGTALGPWSGVVAGLARERIDADLEGLLRAADACRVLVPALRTYAEELRRAQADWGDGERIALEAQARDAAISPAVLPGAEAARARAMQDAELGTNVMLGADDRAAGASEAAARAFEQASWALDGVTPPPAPAQPDGTFGDGLEKAGSDVVGEIGSVLGGVVDHANVFSDRWAQTWSQTLDTATTAVTHPLDAARTVVEGTVAPLADSYRSGGLDEALGRLPGVAAVAFGGKGLTKLGKLGHLVDPEPGPHTPVVPGGGLQRHEDLGGHTLDPRKAHVGATDQELLDRQHRDRVGRVSSYTDRATAECAVSENLTGNRAAIEAWLRDPQRQRPEGFKWLLDNHIGRSAGPNADLSQIADVSKSVVVLKKDAAAPDGYYILSSYPTP